MTQRRFNYTKRQRLTRDRCDIEVVRNKAGELVHAASFTFDDLDLPPDAKVVVEASHEHLFQRFDYGTVAELAPPASVALDRFVVGNDIKFTVKVVQEDVADLGLIVAESGGIRPTEEGEEEGSKVSILKVKASQILEQVPWRVQIDDLPVLLVNSKVPDWRAFARTPAFAWLVYPAVCREVLSYLLITEDYRDDDISDWRGQWIRFGKAMVNAPPPRSDDDAGDREWIEDAVTGFCRRMRLWQDHGRHMFTGE